MILDLVGLISYFDLYLLTEVGSQSEVVDPPLWKSRQKDVRSNLRGKLIFSLIETVDKVLGCWLNALKGLFFEFIDLFGERGRVLRPVEGLLFEEPQDYSVFAVYL